MLCSCCAVLCCAVFNNAVLHRIVLCFTVVYIVVLHRVKFVDRLSFFLMETSSSSFGYFDFRISSSDTINTTVFQTKHEGAWGPKVMTPNINPFPFTAGNNFTLTFHILDETNLRVRQHSQWGTVDA